MNYKIIGDNLQIVEIELEPGESVYSESGTMKYMSESITMDTNTKGGLLKGLKRSISGDTLFITNFKSEDKKGIVAFGGTFPGKIIPLEMQGKSYICQGSSFLCAQNDVDVDLSIQKKLSSAVFGGEGFLLQKISGNGTAFIAACGDVAEFNLQPGEVLKVSTSNAVLWGDTIQYEIQRIKGVKNMLFGGEGLFVTILRGPGKVIVQSMTPRDLAFAIYELIPHNQG